MTNENTSNTLPAWAQAMRNSRQQSRKAIASANVASNVASNRIAMAIGLAMLATMPTYSAENVRTMFGKDIATCYAVTMQQSGTDVASIARDVAEYERGGGPILVWQESQFSIVERMSDAIRRENDANPLLPYRAMIVRCIRSAINKGGIQTMKGNNTETGERLNKRENRHNSRERTYGVANSPKPVRKPSDTRSGIAREFERMIGADIDDIYQSVYTECLTYIRSPESFGVLDIGHVYKVANHAVYSRAKELRQLSQPFEDSQTRNERKRAEQESFGTFAGLGSVYVEYTNPQGYNYILPIDEVVRHLFGNTTLGDAVCELIRNGVKTRKNTSNWDGLTARPIGMSDADWKKETRRYYNWVRTNNRNGDTHELSFSDIARKYDIHREQLRRAVARLRVACRMDTIESIDAENWRESWEDAKNVA